MNKINKHIKLNESGNRYPFKTPDAYFDNLSNQLISKIELEESTHKPSGIIRLLKPMIAIAAGFLLFVSVFNFAIKSSLQYFDLKANKQSLDIEYFLYYNEPFIYETISKEIETDEIDEQTIEAVLLASVSEYELFELNL